MSGTVFTLSEEAGLVFRMELSKRKSKFTGEYEEVIHNFGSLSPRRKFDGNEMKYMNFYGQGR